MKCSAEGCENTEMFKLVAYIPSTIFIMSGLKEGRTTYPLPDTSANANWRHSPLLNQVECCKCGITGTLKDFNYHPLRFGPKELKLSLLGAYVEEHALCCEAMQKGWEPKPIQEAMQLYLDYLSELKDYELIQRIVELELGSAPSDQQLLAVAMDGYEYDAREFLRDPQIALNAPTTCPCCAHVGEFSAFERLEVEGILRCPACYGIYGTCSEEEAEKLVSPIRYDPEVDGPRTCAGVAFVFDIPNAIGEGYRGYFDPVTRKRVQSREGKR